MRPFSFYVASGAVKKQTPDKNTAQAVTRDSAERLALAHSIRGTQKAKYVLENAYEAIRELIDALLASNGYKSYSHEASVAYLHELGFSETEIYAVDRLRKKRNDIKYAGKDAEPAEADEALATAEKVMKKLREKHPHIDL